MRVLDHVRHTVTSLTPNVNSSVRVARDDVIRVAAEETRDETRAQVRLQDTKICVR